MLIKADDLTQLFNDLDWKIQLFNIETSFQSWVSQRKSDDQIEDLLHTILSKLDDNTENQTQDTQETLLPDGLRIKLAKDYLAKYRKITLWGSGINPQTIRFGAIYTDMAWKASNKMDRKPLQHYTDMLLRDEQCPNRRTCVWGESGVGKSVLAAKLCQDWALAVLMGQTHDPVKLSDDQQEAYEKLTETQKDVLLQIKLLVCIILRDTGEARQISEIIKSQLSLDISDTKAIMKYIYSNPASVLLALDGLDEITYDEHSEIVKTLSGQMHPQVGYVVTCRPFAAHRIKLAVDAETQLCGFNEKQINAYIRAYYHIKFPKLSRELVEKMASVLFKKIQESKDLLEMATNPSVLQLMCLLHVETGKIGKDRTEVLKLYTTYLLRQYHEKERDKYGFRVDSYHKQLMDIGKLALSGLQINHFQLIFTKDEILQEHGEQPFKMGFVTELQTNQLSPPKAQFLHKSLQEYLAAYFIVNSPEKESVGNIMKFCSTSSNLMSSQMIIAFIATMSKSMGKIVQSQIRKMISDWENKEEVSPAERLAFLYTMLKDNKQLQFPLPKEIDINIDAYESSTNIIWQVKRFFSGPSLLERLFEMDSSGVTKISVVVGKNSRLSLFKSIKWKQILHIELDFHKTSGPDDGREIEKIMKSATNVTVLVIKNYGDYGQNEKHHRMMYKGLANSFPSCSKLDTLEISCCQLTGDDIVHITANIKEKGSKITKLRLPENNLGGGKLGELARRLPALQELDLTGCSLETEDLERMVADLPDSITRLILAGNNRIRVLGASVIGLASRCPRLATLDLSDCEVIVQDLQALKNMLTKIPQNTNITRLYMEDYANDTEATVDQLVHLCPELVSLGLSGCHLVVWDLKKLLSCMERSTNITRLCMKEKLEGKGAKLGELVRRCPALQELDLAGCGLWREDVEQMVVDMPDSTGITRLRLAGNERIRERAGGAAVRRLLQRTPSLQLLDVWDCELSIPDLLRAAERAVLTNLLVLDLGENHDPQLEVSDYLASMPRLHALSVAWCRCDDVRYLLRLVANLPPTLTHLNVCDNDFGSSVVKVLQHKEPLAQLHRLNIGLYGRDDDVRSIREALQRLNPQLLVYYDDTELLWDMYKDTTQVT